MATPQQFLEKAASYIGIQGTDNIFNTWYWKYRCYNPDLYPWCAAFQSYIGVHDLGMDFVPSASAAGVAHQGTRVRDEDVQPGDWVLFTWDGRQDFSWADHIGVVEWSDINGSGYFGTIEGNTGSVYGGEVARCTRYNWGSYGTAFFRPNWTDSDIQSTESSEETTVPEPSEPVLKSRLVGMDISGWQSGIDIAATDADFVIVKVTGGTHFTNPDWKRQADETLASGKLLGLYHYAVEGESNPDAYAEASYFLGRVGDYIGKFIPVLDWEADALSLPASWAKLWLDEVAAKTGSTPWFYAGALDVNNKDYSIIAEKYPLWLASYLNKYIGAGFVDNPDQTWDIGNWSNLTAYQYTSSGIINGYDGDLDLNVFYGSSDDWAKYVGGDYSAPEISSPEVDHGTGNGPKFAVCAKGQWCDPMIGTTDTGGSNDDFGGIMGKPITYIAIDGVGPYRVCTFANGWLEYVDKYDLDDEEYGMAGDGSEIRAIEIPNSNVRFTCHSWENGWLPDMIGQYDTGGSSDTYGGDMTPIDAIKIVWA